MANRTSIVTPKGKLMWVHIHGEGKDVSRDDKEVKLRKVAAIIFQKDSQEYKDLTSKIDAIWEEYKAENKAAKKRPPKSLGYNELVDEEGNPTGEVAFNFKTNSYHRVTGKLVNITVLNAAGKKVDMGQNMIGNGSIGVIHGDAVGYNFEGTFGISLYLKGIQIIKYVKYEDDEIVGQDYTSEVTEEDSFMGVEDDIDNVPTETDDKV